MRVILTKKFSRDKISECNAVAVTGRYSLITCMQRSTTKKIFLYSFAILFLFSFFSKTYASEFPNDAKTVRVANETSQDQTNVSILPTGTYTILNIIINSKDNRANEVKCGTTTLMLERGSALFFNQEMATLCENKAVTANLYRTSSISIVYVDYNLALRPENFLTNFFLLIIIFLILVYFLRSAISSVGVTRKYQGNNSPDGKEFYQL